MKIVSPHPDAVEHRTLRTSHSKTFQLPDGRMQCVSSLGSRLHYVSDEGDLRSCDTTVRHTGNTIHCDWLPYKFELHKSGVGFDFKSRDTGTARITLTSIGGEPFDRNSRLTPLISGDTITFQDVLHNCDIIFRLLTNRVKTLRVLKSVAAPRTFEWLCEHDESGQGSIETRLSGKDRRGQKLSLISHVSPINDTSFTLCETWSGFVKARDPVTRIQSLSPDVEYPVEIDPTVNYDITADSNDGYERDPPVTANSWVDSPQYLGQGYGSYKFHPAWRFLSVAVPQGATIDSATLTLNVTGKNTAYAGGTIYGNDIDSSDAWNTTLPSAVSKTAASTTLTRAVSTGLKTYDVTAEVQEIVNRGGWASGNNLSLFALTYESTYRVTYIEDYSAAGTDEPTLSITYTGGGGGPTTHNLLLLGCGT